MTDDDEPKTIPPRYSPTRIATPAPDVSIRESDPGLMANAPPWAAELLRRFDQSLEAEHERAEQAHRAANKIADAFLKNEAALSLARTEVEGCRADIRSMRRHFDQTLAHMEKRFDALEARVAALEAAKQSA